MIASTQRYRSKFVTTVYYRPRVRDGKKKDVQDVLKHKRNVRRDPNLQHHHFNHKNKNNNNNTATAHTL